MKHSILFLAAFAGLNLSTPAFSADKPADGKLLTTRPGPADKPAIAKAPAPSQAPAQVNVPPPPPPPPPPQSPPKVVSAKYSVAEAKALEPITIKLDGINLSPNKDCGGTIDWGDGTSKFDNMLGQNGAWRTLNKTFVKAGTFTATVLPKSYSGSPCVSDAPINVTIKINPPAPLPPSTMTKLVVSPLPNPLARLISTTWNGGGNPKAACSYILNFGDGTSKKTGAGPIQPGSDEQHVYAPGTYSVIITPSNADYDSCSLGPDAGPKTFTVQ
jgi:hypothetical protein